MEPIFISQDFITKDFQNAHLAHFHIADGLNKADEALIIEAIHTDAFIEGNKIALAKQYPEEPFMDSLFQYRLLDEHHLKVLDKVGLYDLLEKGPAISEAWTDDEKTIYSSHLNWVKAAIDKYIADQYFIISKDWVPQLDPIVNLPESTVYKYFIAIFWFDRELQLLTCCELSYD